MTSQLRFALVLCVAGILGVMTVVLRPQAEEVEPSEPAAVSEADLKMYIQVYTAMQDNHDLTIEEAIKPHHLSLDEFRNVERRIQADPRFVERVRQALLDHATEHSVYARSLGTPSPRPTAIPPTTRRPATPAQE